MPDEYEIEIQLRTNSPSWRATRRLDLSLNSMYPNPFIRSCLSRGNSILSICKRKCRINRNNTIHKIRSCFEYYFFQLFFFWEKMISFKKGRRKSKLGNIFHHFITQSEFVRSSFHVLDRNCSDLISLQEHSDHIRL